MCRLTFQGQNSRRRRKATAIAWLQMTLRSRFCGAIVGTDSTVSVPTGIDRMTLVPARGAVACAIKRVRYWRKRLTNAQLQALTA